MQISAMHPACIRAKRSNIAQEDVLILGDFNSFSNMTPYCGLNIFINKIPITLTTRFIWLKENGARGFSFVNLGFYRRSGARGWSSCSRCVVYGTKHPATSTKPSELFANFYNWTWCVNIWLEALQVKDRHVQLEIVQWIEKLLIFGSVLYPTWTRLPLWDKWRVPLG